MSQIEIEIIDDDGKFFSVRSERVLLGTFSVREDAELFKAAKDRQTGLPLVRIALHQDGSIYVGEIGLDEWCAEHNKTLKIELLHGKPGLTLPEALRRSKETGERFRRRGGDEFSPAIVHPANGEVSRFELWDDDILADDWEPVPAEPCIVSLSGKRTPISELLDATLPKGEAGRHRWFAGVDVASGKDKDRQFSVDDTTLIIGSEIPTHFCQKCGYAFGTKDALDSHECDNAIADACAAIAKSCTCKFLLQGHEPHCPLAEKP